MPQEPDVKRSIVFIDGQNLFHSVREAFGYSYPNYDVQALANAVCLPQGWHLAQVRFYTGIPAQGDDAFWNRFWSGKLLAMKRQGVIVYSRALKRREAIVRCPHGSSFPFRYREEKGVDVRLSLDVISLAYQNEYDVAVIVSQDQDLSEVAEEVRRIARKQSRWLKIASAFPYAQGVSKYFGIDKTDWIGIDKPTYDSCIDPHDYRRP